MAQDQTSALDGFHNRHGVEPRLRANSSDSRLRRIAGLLNIDKIACRKQRCSIKTGFTARPSWAENNSVPPIASR